MERHVDLREQTPVEYFKEQVESALARQHLQAGDLTEYYLVNLLCRYVRHDHGDADYGEPLAVRLARALQTGGTEQRARLRVWLFTISTRATSPPSPSTTPTSIQNSTASANRSSGCGRCSIAHLWDKTPCSDIVSAGCWRQ